ncbi:chaperonin 10-like protein [Rhodocollybia butyracea]|uniref:Chaperonin 10-like protein n=1 Tax=Rhodocollybia butyracea TaxID=206335 RepID=A0A9P5PPJ2_9AGAR|nr:chaperonin 10-like protein [Rhodocollybia butyracea]
MRFFSSISSRIKMASLPETFKALQILPELKGIKVVQIPSASLVKDLPEDQLVIRVRAAGLNPTDWRHVLGRLGTAGTIAGCDAAGEVVEVGPAVKHLKVGDRAGGFTFGGSHQTENGAYSEYVRLVSAACFKLPEAMTYEEAASFPIPHFTAVQALYHRLNFPKPFSPNPKRESIVIWGGSSAVGHHAVQLAALSGLKVFVTASPDVHDELKALGAEACFDYKDADVAKKILAAAGEEDILYGLDTRCEKGSTDALDVMSPSRGGRIIAIGYVSGETKQRRKDVQIDLIIVFSELGFPFNYGHMMDFPAIPADKSATLEYVTTDMPRILENWKAGQGSPKFKTQRLRHLQGGLENIQEGLEIMKEGNYAREKLVYTIA